MEECGAKSFYILQLYVYILYLYGVAMFIRLSYTYKK